MFEGSLVCGRTVPVEMGVTVMTGEATKVGAGVSVSVLFKVGVSVGVEVDSGRMRVEVGFGRIVGMTNGRGWVYFERSLANKLKFRLLPQIDLA